MASNESQYGPSSCKKIEDAHELAINSVQWHPTDSNLILSEGYAASMNIHDIRKETKEPVVSMRGHIAGDRTGAIYKPAFARNGRFVE